MNSDRQSTRASAYQFLKFGLVGASNTILSCLLNIAILRILKDACLEWDYIAANIISFTISIFWAFYWNNRYVFARKEGEKRNLWRALGKSFLAYGFTGYILNNILSYVWITVLGVSKYLAPLLNLFLSVPVNFILNKKWAFRA